MTTKGSGDWAEALVAEYLRERGYRIDVSKYRCRFGEIDLVAHDRGTLCFVEVKMRSNLRYGLPREYVTYSKQEKLRTTAEYYRTRSAALTWRRSTRTRITRRSAPASST